MSRTKASALAVMLALSLLAGPAGLASRAAGSAPAGRSETVSASPPVVAKSSAERTRAAPSVTLWPASGAATEFWTQNGEAMDGVPPEAREVPHLVLRRNGTLANTAGRTLIVQVSGLVVPPPGATVTLVFETQHADPDLEDDAPPSIEVWRESRWIANATGETLAGVHVGFRHTFTDTIAHGGKRVPTPTDYYHIRLLVTDAGRPAGAPMHVLSRDHAFLLEDQWVVPLPQVQEASPGAAPSEMVVYTSDMVPFRRDSHDPATWLPRARVPGYVRDELIPAMVEAFRLQTDGWGFPWYPEWTGYRGGADAERLSVALTDGQTWYHGKAPGQGNAGLSLNASRAMVEYESLTDGLLSTFHHELFHVQQRNLQQHLGGSGQVGGIHNAWAFYSEGMAVLASSVGQPDVQLSQTWGARAYLLNARGFVGREGISGGDLNKSYGHMNGYHAAAYWRFLYEQCGGLGGAAEDPAAGMAVIREVLETLYAGDVVDIDASTDVVGATPAIMDTVLAGSACPFRTYRESLLAFGRAVYGLRLDGGRCTGPGSPVGCGFYDPKGVYHRPGVSTLAYRGEDLAYSAAQQPQPAGIPSSFGMDLIEVELDAGGAPLVIEVHGAPGSAAEFGVQAWLLPDGVGPGEEVVTWAVAGGQLVAAPLEIDPGAHHRLGLVITRLDAEEDRDPVGAYTLVLRPGS